MRPAGARVRQSQPLSSVAPRPQNRPQGDVKPKQLVWKAQLVEIEWGDRELDETLPQRPVRP